MPTNNVLQGTHDGDLKDYRADCGFQILTGDEAFACLIVLIVCAVVFL